MARIPRTIIALLVVSSAWLSVVPSSAATTYGCGTGDQAFRSGIFREAESCGYVIVILSSAATGTLRVIGDEWTGDLYVMALNSSDGARCEGVGQESYLWGCDVSGSFLTGMPNNGLPADPSYGTRRVSLKAGVYKLAGHAGPLAPDSLTGRWRVELVLD